MKRRRSVVASVTLALLLGAAAAAHAGPSEGRTPPVPDGFTLSDFVSDGGFESGVAGFIPGSALDGAVGLDTTDPLKGSSSLHVTLNAFGRVSVVAQFPFQAGPLADSVTVAGKLRVNSSAPAGKSVSVCSVAYVTTDPAPRTLCQTFPADPSHVADVFVSQPMSGARLDRAYFELQLADSGTLDVTLDDAHLYVVGQTGIVPTPTPTPAPTDTPTPTPTPTPPPDQLLPVPAGFALTDLVSDDGFETSTAGFAPFSRSEGSVARTTTSPIAGAASLKVHVNKFGRVGVVHNYPYDGGPIADSVTVAGRIRIDGASPGRVLQVCAVAYFFLDPEPQQSCRNLSVSGHAVQTVFVTQPAFDRQLDRAFFQMKLDDSGTIDATVDDAHLYVVGRPLS